MKVKIFTYVGAIIGSYFGWIFPLILGWKGSFFSSFGFSIIFGIIGIFGGYYLYKFLRRKF